MGSRITVTTPINDDAWRHGNSGARHDVGTTAAFLSVNIDSMNSTCSVHVKIAVFSIGIISAISVFSV